MPSLTKISHFEDNGSCEIDCWWHDVGLIGIIMPVIDGQRLLNGRCHRTIFRFRSKLLELVNMPWIQGESGD